MRPPRIFKYSNLISTLLFGIIALVLVGRSPGFLFGQQTISKIILFLNNPFDMAIFRFNFLLKALLDLSFWWYVIDRQKIGWRSKLAGLMTVSTVFWGSMAIFVEGAYTFWHTVMVYGYGVELTIIELLLAKRVKDRKFILVTRVMAIIGLVISFGALYLRATNVYIQVVGVSLFYVWMVMFVFKYLRK